MALTPSRGALPGPDRSPIPIIPFRSTPERPWTQLNAAQTTERDGYQLTLEASLGTDLIRSSAAPTSWTDKDGLAIESAPAYVFPVQGDFRASVLIRGTWSGDWDQGGILLMEEKGATRSWIKAGVEHDGGCEFVSSVAADPYSNWCCYPLPFETTSSSDPHGQPLLLVLEKLSSHVWLSIGVPSDDNAEGSVSLQGVREIKGFATQTDENTTWLLGVMAASPPRGGGDRGAIVDFYNFGFEQL